jgi:hypothetical protein
MITLALVFNMILFIYQQLIMHFNFFPFNNIERDSLKKRVLYSVISGAISIFTLLSIRLGLPALMGVAACILAIFAFYTIYKAPHLFTRTSFDLNHVILLMLQLICFLLTLISYLFSTPKS